MAYLKAIIDAIRDSLWFKALDLQNCGLTNDLADEIIKLLDQNKTLAIFDVRSNSNVSEETLNEINRRLEFNELSCKNEYRWLNLPQKRESSLSLKQKRVSSAGNIRQKQINKNNSRSTEALTTTTTTTRPRSATMMIRQVKRSTPPPPQQPIIYRKPVLMPMPMVIKKMKAKVATSLPILPMFERRSRQPVVAKRSFENSTRMLKVME